MITGTWSATDWAELLAGSLGLRSALNARPQSAPYSARVDGGAGPHDSISAEPHGSTNAGISVQPGDGRKYGERVDSGSDSLRAAWMRKMLRQEGSVAKCWVHRLR